MRALLATMQSGITLRADAGEVDARRKRRGAIETPRRGYMLHQARQPGTGYVNRRARPLRLLPVAKRLRVAVRILVTVLFVFAVAVCLAIPLGRYLSRVYQEESSLLDFLQPLEKRLYRFCRINEKAGMNWKQYLSAIS